VFADAGLAPASTVIIVMSGFHPSRNLRKSAVSFICR
jgi:hypothetical protein